MVREPPEPRPRTFFLNEQHELARGEKDSGGGLPKLASIDWNARSTRIHDSLSTAASTIKRSQDPLRESRYFLAASPTPNVVKLSDNKRRAPKGVVEEATDYAGEHSRVFRRLGLDLLAVDAQGRALVHAPVGRIDQLLRSASALPQESLREQARWVTIDSFAIPPESFRVDSEWLQNARPGRPIDAVVELQPLLTRVEIEQVVRAIIDALGDRAGRERFTKMGTDFSGRHWYRGLLSVESLRLIAQSFFSVQSLHRPLHTAIEVAGSTKARKDRGKHLAEQRAAPVDPALLPCVAVVDTGIPEGHAQIAQYVRGRYTSPDKAGMLAGDHASFVASRVVFGDCDFSAGVRSATPDCAVLDVNVAESARHIDDKALLPAMDAVVGAYPDVRVFNLSFGDYKALNRYSEVDRREKLLLLQDLDNWVFARDAVVVVAAGNSPPGIVPNPAYPHHLDHEAWALGSWACGFNTIKCGSYVGRLASGGLVNTVGWPSPFTRVGPGLCDATIPEFAANGGNGSPDYQYRAGLGVWGCSAAGMWEDRPGTSFAAPLLAREAALAVGLMQRHCEQGARPFAATVKAFLSLTASPPPVDMPVNVHELAKRTLGRGTASADRLNAPAAHSAVMLWQGVLSGPEDIARVQVPIPKAWLKAASRPILRMIGAWESPVNQAVEHLWASRRVKAQLRPEPNSGAIRGAELRSHRSYPILDRSYDLSAETLKKRNVVAPRGDFWALDVSYEQIAEYTPTIDFSPHQRVGFAMELLDKDEDASPQPAMQALPQVVTMARLTIPENRIPNPIIVKPRF